MIGDDQRSCVISEFDSRLVEWTGNAPRCDRESIFSYFADVVVLMVYVSATKTVVIFFCISSERFFSLSLKKAFYFFGIWSLANSATKKSICFATDETKKVKTVLKRLLIPYLIQI